MDGERKKISIITLGCAKNQVDTEALMGQLAGNNLEIAQNIEDARIAIINTCGFIEDAKKQSIEVILETLKRKESGLLDEVYVMGCLSERYHTELEAEIPEVDRFFGSHDQPQILSQLGVNYRRELLGERVLTTARPTAYLKISEGCDNPCSFCAIPLMRGRHRSKPIEAIMEEVVKLTEKGVRELILIGQDTTSYGLDVYGGRKLAALLRALSTVEPLAWIRLMYAYPAKFPLDVLDAMADNPSICRYLDIPVQHGSDRMLKSMRRGITRRATEELLARIRQAIPGIALRTTIIAGYPGETEEDVAELLDFLRLTRFDRLGVFTYSQEEGTTAFDLGDPLPQETKEARRATIMEVQREIAAARNEELLGSTLRALVERHEEGAAIGRTERDAPEIDGEIIITADGRPLPDIGKFVDVRVTHAVEYDLHGIAA